jgi:hypothetical protein
MYAELDRAALSHAEFCGERIEGFTTEHTDIEEGTVGADRSWDRS